MAKSGPVLDASTSASLIEGYREAVKPKSSLDAIERAIKPIKGMTAVAVEKYQIEQAELEAEEQKSKMKKIF